MKRLWESDHSYYCTEGCYYSNACHQQFASWAAFKDGGSEGFYEADLDLNLLFRWDWATDEHEDTEEDIGECNRLKLYFMKQRKAMPFSVHITVTKEDEPEIRAWILQRWTHLKLLWSPLGEKDQ